MLPLEPKNVIDGEKFAAISEMTVSDVEAVQLLRYACDDACDMAYDASDNADSEIAASAREQLAEMLDALGEITTQIALAYSKANEVIVELDTAKRVEAVLRAEQNASNN